MLAIDAREARITGAAAFVQQPMMRIRPGEPVVEADLHGVMGAALLRMRIRKQQHVFLLAVALVVEPQQTPVAVRLDERVAAGGVWLPRLSEILCHGDRAETFVIIADIEHDRPVASCAAWHSLPPVTPGLPTVQVCP